MVDLVCSDSDDSSGSGERPCDGPPPPLGHLIKMRFTKEPPLLLLLLLRSKESCLVLWYLDAHRKENLFKLGSIVRAPNHI